MSSLHDAPLRMHDLQACRRRGGGRRAGAEGEADTWRGVRCAQTLLLLFSVDDLTGFEITKLVELPDPWGIVVVWGLVLPLTYIVSSSLTNLVLRDFLILKARAAP